MSPSIIVTDYLKQRLRAVPMFQQGSTKRRKFQPLMLKPITVKTVEIIYCL